jgi:ribosomal protein S18 acetylase RimI-like enzyme
MSPRQDRGITYGLLPRSGWPDALRILAEENVSIAGLAHESVRLAFLEDSLSTSQPLIMSACESQEVLGLVLCVIDPARYWPLLARRHPATALRILGARLTRKLGAGRLPGMETVADRSILDLMVPNASGKQWSDSSPEIAKIVFIGVDGRHRRRSIGRGLYEELFRQLRSRAVRRVDACINWPNVPSIRLHRASGWQLFARPESVMATYDL